MFPAPAPVSGEADAVVASSLRVPPLLSSLVSAPALAPAVTLEPPPFAPSLSSPPSVRASTVPRTASATTTAMITRVRRGTTSVSGALGTGLGARSGGGVITGHPELRPSETALACVFPSRTSAAPLEADVEADPDAALAAPLPWDTAGAEVAGEVEAAGEAEAAGAADAASEALAGTFPPLEPAVPLPDLVRVAAADVAAAPAALRTERSAPRSPSPPARSCGCAGNGTTRVASAAGSGSAGFGSGAWITAVSMARARPSSIRCAGSLVSRP